MYLPNCLNFLGTIWCFASSIAGDSLPKACDRYFTASIRRLSRGCHRLFVYPYELLPIRFFPSRNLFHGHIKRTLPCMEASVTSSCLPACLWINPGVPLLTIKLRRPLLPFSGLRVLVRRMVQGTLHHVLILSVWVLWYGLCLFPLIR